MVTKRHAATSTTPAGFDLNAWIQRFKPATVSVKLHHRGDLLPRIAELAGVIEKAATFDKKEMSISESDPAAENVAEYEALVAEWEAGGFETFEFRPMTAKIHNASWEAHQASDSDDVEDLLFDRMARTCTSHPGLDGPGFRALRDHVGDLAFAPLARAFNEAYNGGGEPDAPFSLKPSPIPDGGGLSSVSEPPESGETPR